MNIHGESEERNPLRRMIIVCLALAILGMARPAATTAAESGPDTSRPIHPGAPVQIYPGPAYPEALRETPFGVCTLNFVFRGRERAHPQPRQRKHVHTYIGTAGHCMQSRAIGQRVAAPDVGEFGTLAFRTYCGTPNCDGRPFTDDFALIRVDADKLHWVSPVVPVIGTAPSGFTTSEETSAGDVLLVPGQGVPFSIAGGSTWASVLEDDDSVAYTATPQGTGGHSGGPVVRLSDGKALGVLIGGDPPDIWTGATVERILTLLAEARFEVGLVTWAP